MRTHDVYELDCCRCRRTVEFACGAAVAGVFKCKCGALLPIAWNGDLPSIINHLPNSVE